MTSVTWVTLLSKPAENIEHGPQAWSTLPRPQGLSAVPACLQTPSRCLLIPLTIARVVSVLRWPRNGHLSGWFGHFSLTGFPPRKLRAWCHLVGWGQWSECVARRRPCCSVPSDTPSACLARGLLVKFGWFSPVLPNPQFLLSLIPASLSSCLSQSSPCLPTSISLLFTLELCESSVLGGTLEVLQGRLFIS